ncbi:MAG: ABC transporter ATP-binding protein [Alphaproteobacteria bacterium]|jgi:branched-chain amino acid transport system ATP-binding protein|nr:ABC transporter ATP-binding protein [Rhodospirillaceae bacterium]MDP6020785.1 ABC transporter ATP-binding protein [Alphaproteobacteria bacterium]MDP6256596.1 ABC transporter ATP-binding protein [Alphaproteobacteria bacterium]MDP7458722.1 ABC transporter ATP-binding protein [Alphaproteobacteria bacterium]HJM90878.1 ABC transporter ATP-binding protein [Alphaproteobacteria bacterium]|tara:strand:- start:4563 stop:5270 length:708 start_codon:yes stop_codon:yes gene_type:complete
MAQLEVDNIRTAYGLSKVLFGVSLTVEPGEVVALVGRNGVGKTTTIRSIMGMAPPQEGSIRWIDQDITGIPVHHVAKLGIGFVPEDRRIFPELTVWENLDIGRRPAMDGGKGWSEEQVFELFPDLKDIQERKGGVLSGGQQQMLTIARSLMGNPKLLLLDEPSEGLAPIVVESLRERIHMLKTGGLSIVLAEQNLDFVLYLSDRVHILEKGEVVYTGTPVELRDNPDVQTKYLTV